MPLSAQGRNFLTSVEDVSLWVLSFCGISGVLAVSQTCTRLHTLAFDKQVWLALLRDLDARSFLDRLPGQSFLELSTTELVDLAKRLVQGPQTWPGTTPHLSPPLIARQHVLHPDINTSIDGYRWTEAKLLPGGRYILFNNNNFRIECWNVQENRLIWKHQSQLYETSTMVFAAEVVNCGQAAVIMIGLSKLCGNSELYNNFVEIVHLDFLSETSRLLFITRAPNTLDDDDPFCHPRVCSDIAAVGVSMAQEVLLMNWKTQCVILLTVTSRSLALVHKHVIVIDLGPIPATSCIGICDIQSFDKYWTPGDEFIEHWTPVSTKDIPKLASEIFTLPSSRPIVNACLSVLESPVCEYSYTIWLYIYSRSMTTKGGFATDCAICKFSLFFPPRSLPQIQLRSFGHSDQRYDISGDISYTGHAEATVRYVPHVLALRNMCGVTNTSTAIIANYRIVELPGCGVYVHVSAYSGALTYVTQNSIVINYYE